MVHRQSKPRYNLAYICSAIKYVLGVQAINTHSLMVHRQSKPRYNLAYICSTIKYVLGVQAINTCDDRQKYVYNNTYCIHNLVDF